MQADYTTGVFTSVWKHCSMTLRIPGTIWSKDDVSPTFDRQVNLDIVYQAFADYHPKYVKIMGLRFYFILWLHGTAKIIITTKLH